MTLCGFAHAASNPASLGVTQGYQVGTSSVLIATATSGVSRSQLIVQASYLNPAGSYVCVAIVPPGSGNPATCSTTGADNGGWQLQPGQPLEFPDYKSGVIPQGDVEAVCSTTGCVVTVLQQGSAR